MSILDRHQIPNDNHDYLAYPADPAGGGPRPGGDAHRGLGRPRYRASDALRPTRSRRGRPATILVMVVLLAGDYANALTVWELALPTAASSVASVVAAGMALGGLVVAHLAGRTWATAGTDPTGKRAAGLLLALWVMLGATLLALRAVFGAGSAVATGGAFAGVSSTATSPHPLAIAIAFFALWLVTGAVAAATAARDHTPAAEALSALGAAIAAAGRRLADATAASTRAAHTVVAQRQAKSHLDAERVQTIAEVAARCAQLKAWSRIELTRVLGDPAATNDIYPRPDQGE